MFIQVKKLSTDKRFLEDVIINVDAIAHITRMDGKEETRSVVHFKNGEDIFVNESLDKFSEVLI